jgi:hypothetical protein
MRMVLKFLVPPAALLLTLACQTRAVGTVYGPWVEGLTLAFEDPSQPQPQRSTERLQLRVSRSALTPGAPGIVQLDLASSRGQLSLLVRHQDGGTALVGDDGRVLAQTLPPGFPATTTWVERGTTFRVIGRATWSNAAILPSTSDPVGIWVEAQAPNGLRRRVLYLPNLGEVEAAEERNGGWITVNRLVAYGFTDLPAIKRP